MKLLVELYKAFSPSNKEDEVSYIVKRELEKIGLTFSIDNFGQIYNVKKDSILLCAHMDQVSDTKITKVIIEEDKIHGDGNIGADDKNGIWIILHLLKEFKDLSFIFSTNEERGGNISSLLKNIDITSNKYGLVFDRRGNSDIIGKSNYYCTDEFDKDISKVGEVYNYKSVIGSFSDCNKISDYISCVNLSAGYFNSHTPKEYTIISDLKVSLSFGRDILNTINKKYNKPEPRTYTSYNYNYNTYDRKRTYADTYNTRVVKIDKTTKFYYCDNCKHWFSPKLMTKSMKKGPDYYCPICNNELFFFERKKLKEEIYYYYCMECDLAYCHDVGETLKEICEVCNKRLTKIL